MNETETISVTITLAFQDATDRNFKFNGVSSEILEDGTMVDKVKAINAQMPASFANTFVSQSGAPCIMISALKSVRTKEEVIYNAS